MNDAGLKTCHRCGAAYTDDEDDCPACAAKGDVGCLFFVMVALVGVLLFGAMYVLDGWAKECVSRRATFSWHADSGLQGHCQEVLQ